MPDVAEQVPVAAPIADTPQPIESSASITEHVQAYDPHKPATLTSDPDAPAIERPRHRAISQKASAADQPAISALTKQLREAEEAAGIVQKPGESQRVFELRRRVEMATALRDLRKTPQPPAAASTTAPPPRPVTLAPPAAFTDPEPQLQQFAGQDDPYGSHLRAHLKWELKKDAFDSQQVQTATQTTEQIKQADAAFQTFAEQTTTAHEARMQAFLEATPAATEIFSAAVARNDVDLSPVMLVAIHTSERGPEMALALAQQPGLADELLLATAHQPAFDAQHHMNPLVATTQRRLLRSLQTPQAGTTGSAAGSRPITVAPRPLNPVRTAPQTPSEPAPRDGSLVDHARSHPYGASPKYRR